ncbi:MAG: cobalamin-independent methionine synthase II family protein [Solirubrobacteraceae bacterium]|nr:cobalamin-independent methionine synthase II family protein [Solirubrobacteraceae bacterium]
MYRAEVVGSMLRPSYLIEARNALEAGTLSAAEFKRIEDRAVDQVIAVQEASGVEVVTDGEMRRFMFMGPITETVEGIEVVEHGNPMPWANPEGELDWVLETAVTGPLRKKRSLVAEEYSYARARARTPLKVTVPSPLMLFGLWNPRYTTAVYQDAFEMFAAGAEIGRSEIEELVALGCEYIQVDAPELATLVDPRVREWAEERGMPPERMLTEGIDIINSMVDGITGVRLAIHLCRGNNAGMWMASGGYDMIAEALFKRAHAFDAYLLEYDDERSGSFDPIAQAPDASQVVLGLVSTKRPEDESREAIAGRIDDAARRFPREQLGVSTQCGFASVVFGNPITQEDQERKLRLVAEVAETVWG